MTTTPLTGKHVLLTLIGFFGVIFAINGAFVYYALESWSGLDIDNSFIHGLSFEEDVREAHDWRVEIDPEELGGNRVRLNVAIERADGRTISPYAMDAEVRRPAVDVFDQHIELAQQGPHRYVGEVTLAGRGQWQIRVRGRNEQQAVLFRADKRLYLKP
jgi:nitrogen fixation protein FixH